MPLAGLRQALFSPRSIAIIGASDDLTKTAARPLRFLRQAGFEGKIYPINPRRDTVLGEPAWPSLAALPEVPEHVYILTPTEPAIIAAAEAARLGVRIATILAGGFSETGDAGTAREQQLREICHSTGMRIVGPSSLGIVNVAERLVLTANAAFAEPGLRIGRTMVASHSGSMIGALVSRGISRGIGFARLVSVGNEVDLSLGEICEATLDDPAIDSYLLFLETLRHSEALRRFALGAAARGKPVIAYKLGRSVQAAELAISHTGALAGEDDLADMFLRECGIARVETLDALLEGVPLLRRLPVKTRDTPKVGIVTTTGGGAAMVVDELGIRGIAVAAPTSETLARLKTAGVAVNPGRIVDLTLAGTRYDVMKGALDVLLTAPEFDLIVAVVGSSARFQPDLAVRPVIDSAGGPKPLAAFLVPDAPDALARLAEAGVPGFRTPESCADAITAGFQRRQPRSLPGTVSSGATQLGRILDELDAYAILGHVGIPCAPAEVLDANALPAKLSIPFPVAAKILSAKIPHKTDAGGVVLGIADHRALLDAIRQIRNAVTRCHPGVSADRVLVQPMIDGVGEVLVGYRVDAQVGPVVMLAAGGVLTEIYRDRSLRLAPVDDQTAWEMIHEVRALKALAGYRGKPAGDLEGVAHAIVAMSRLALYENEHVMEAEINPLVVRPAGEGVLAVDALVRLGQDKSGRSD